MATKRQLIDDPESCLNKAADDEPLFLLRGQDIFAPTLVRAWVVLARLLSPFDGGGKIREAEQCAAAMELWPSRKIPD